MKTRMTMTEAAFYQLYKAHREAKKKGEKLDLMPVHAFMGEVYCEETGMWGYVSYECSARLSEMYSDNPGLLHREMITGKSGAKYFGYKIADGATPLNIKDGKLHQLYDRCRHYWISVEMRATLPA